MTDDQAAFVRENLLPIIRQVPQYDAPGAEPNPLRPMLWQLIWYVDWLEGQRRPLKHAAFWRRMDRAVRHVGKFPAWLRGSRKNERETKP